MKNISVEEKIKQAFTDATPSDFDAVIAGCENDVSPVKTVTAKPKKTYRVLGCIAAALILAVGCTFGYMKFIDGNGIKSDAELGAAGKQSFFHFRNKGDDPEPEKYDVNGQSAPTNDKHTDASDVLLSKEQIIEIAFSSSGVGENDVTELVYEEFDLYSTLKFICGVGDTFYEAHYYQISRVNGEILCKEITSFDTPVKPPESEPQISDETLIGEDAAMTIALDHAHLKETDVENLKCDLIDTVYIVKFVYEEIIRIYEIDPVNGTVLDARKEEIFAPPAETNDPKTIDQPVETNALENQLISELEAIKIALADAGLSNPEKPIETICITEDVGDITIRVVKFVYNGFDYKYEINAESGEIISVGKIEIKWFYTKCWGNPTDDVKKIENKSISEKNLIK